jgi:putative aldouronate transport system substrate-binding protein
MNKLKKRILTGVMATCLLLAAGCGMAGNPGASGSSASAMVEETTEAIASTSPQAETEENKPLQAYELTYYFLANTISPDRDRIVEQLNALTTSRINATVDLVLLDWATWTDKFNTAINSGEKIDIAFTADWYGYVDQVANGYFLPLNDPSDNLLEKYASETVAALGKGFMEGSRIGGVNYAVPTDKEFAVNAGIVWNKALADKYGLDMTKPKKIADLEPMLKVIHDNEPNIIPYLGGNDCVPFVDLSGGAAIGVDYSDLDDRTMKHIWEMPLQIENAKARKRFMDLGYIPKEAATDNLRASDHVLLGDFFVIEMATKPEKGKSTELSAATGNKVSFDEAEWTPYTAVSLHAGGSMLAIPTTSGDSARAMMFINLLHTDPEVANLLVWGLEGIHHKHVGETEQGVKIVEALPDNAWTSASLPWTLGSVFIHWLGSNESPKKHELFQLTKTQSAPHVTLGYRFSKKADYQAQYGVLSNVMVQYDKMLQVGAVEDFDSTYKEFMDKLKAAGIDEVKASLQADLDEYLSNVGK